MNDVLVLGGGFAGVLSIADAERAARSVADCGDLRVRLINAGHDPVVRPLLYERNPANMRIPLDRLLGPIGVTRDQRPPRVHRHAVPLRDRRGDGRCGPPHDPDLPARAAEDTVAGHNIAADLLGLPMLTLTAVPRHAGMRVTVGGTGPHAQVRRKRDSRRTR